MSRKAQFADKPLEELHSLRQSVRRELRALPEDHEPTPETRALWRDEVILGTLIDTHKSLEEALELEGHVLTGPESLSEEDKGRLLRRHTFELTLKVSEDGAWGYYLVGPEDGDGVPTYLPCRGHSRQLSETLDDVKAFLEAHLAGLRS